MYKTMTTSMLSLAAIAILAAPALAAPGDFTLERQIARNIGIMDGISIMADNGMITLSGQVENQHNKDAAVAAAGSIQGVRGVTDHIEIVSGN